LVLVVGRLTVGLHLWLRFRAWPTITYYHRSEETGGHNLRIGPFLIGWKWGALKENA
jgi:hypothetical protein